jgi:hypothetical protein
MSRTLHIRFPRLMVGLVIGIAVAAGGTQLFAQALPAKTVRGTIEAINPDGTISIIEALSNDPWYAKLTFGQQNAAQNSKIAVIGTAEPAALTSGTWVEFKAELNSKTGVGAGEIATLKIYEPTDVTPPGMYLEGGPDAAAEVGKKPTALYIVRAQVKKATKTELQVYAPESGNSPGKNIKVKLAGEVKIGVDLVDPQMARKGDDISVEGKLAQVVEGTGKNKTPGIVTGDKVTITLAQPLGATKKRPTKK